MRAEQIDCYFAQCLKDTKNSFVSKFIIYKWSLPCYLDQQ